MCQVRPQLRRDQEPDAGRTQADNMAADPDFKVRFAGHRMLLDLVATFLPSHPARTLQALAFTPGDPRITGTFPATRVRAL